MIRADADLLRLLRGADAALAAVAPSPRLAARIRRDVRKGGRIARLFAWLGLDARRLLRPLALAFALAALLLVASTHRDALAPAPRDASGKPEEASEPIAADRARADAGPEDARPGRRRAAPPAIHAPALDPDPRAIPPVAAPTTSAREAAPIAPEPLGSLEAHDEDDLPLDAPTRPARRRAEVDSALPLGAAIAPPSRARPDGLTLAPSPAPPPESTSASAPEARGAAEAPSSCTAGSLGYGICVEPTIFKSQAGGAFCPAGLWLTDFQLDTGTCDDGLFARVTFNCCPALPPEPVPEKEASPGGSICVEEKIAAGACMDVSELQAKAEATCGAAGMTLADRKFYGACADEMATDAWFTCCPSTPEPDPATCVESTISSGSCQDMGALKTEVVTACPGGQYLADVIFEGACPDGEALDARIVCCAPPGNP